MLINGARLQTPRYIFSHNKICNQYIQLAVVSIVMLKFRVNKYFFIIYLSLHFYRDVIMIDLLFSNVCRMYLPIWWRSVSIMKSYKLADRLGVTNINVWPAAQQKYPENEFISIEANPWFEQSYAVDSIIHSNMI